MRLTRLFAPCIALALIVAGTATGHAENNVDCSTGGNLQAAINLLSAGQTLIVTGICTGNSAVNTDNTDLVAGSGGATIDGQITIQAQFVRLDGTTNGLTINGMGVSGANVGVIVQPGASASFANCTIENWSAAGVSVQLNGSVGISGGTFENNGDGIDVQSGASATIGAQPNFISGTIQPVTITGNTGDGVNVSRGGSVTIANGTISSNGGQGVNAIDGAFVVLGSNINGASGSPTAITANSQGGINVSNATVKIDGASITGNTGGPAISASFSTVSVNDAMVTVPSTLGQPAIEMFRGSLYLTSSSVTGPGDSSTVVAAGGSVLVLQGSTITAADPSAKDATVLAVDGSTIESLGNNTLRNTAMPSGTGTVLTLSNASTFHELTASYVPVTPSADTLLGLATVQVQSNMELGTGTTASSWIGNITVLQNSSFRMDGGMTITGSVTLSQSSNGFFNKGSGGTNTVTAGVTCVSGHTHVAGPTLVMPTVPIAAAGAAGCASF